jgi:DeoR/GlpR family transcriptional regulator of sugar metabolism
MMVRTTDSPQERRQNILEDLRLNGKVVAIEQSRLYGVSVDTIRRDLGELASAGLLRRVHGGALPISPSTAPYAERDRHALGAKVALALAARELARDGQVIIFGGGTTNSAIARHLPPNLRATAVTASPGIALDLANYQHIQVILIGGRLNKTELLAADAEAVAQMKRFMADICFLGVCSIHPEVGYSVNNYEEVTMARTLIQQSGEVVATVTAEKLGTIAPFIAAPIDKITHIITEKQVADEALAPYILQGVQVVKAG